MKRVRGRGPVVAVSLPAPYLSALTGFLSSH